MSSDKRGSMTRKRQTQVELERENSELKKQVQRLQKRLKQSLRQLRKHEDIELDVHAALDLEQEATFQDMLVGKKEEESNLDSDYIVVQLPNGHIRKIKKRITNE